MHLLTVSAKNETALEQLVDRYLKYLKTHSKQELANICFTANTGRSHFSHRLALVGDSVTEIIKKLENIKVAEELKQSDAAPNIVFLFPGKSSEYMNMGRKLFETQPTFRKALERCDEIIRSYIPETLIQILYPEPEEVRTQSSEFRSKDIALFAVEYALAELWKSWGIEPDAVMGQDVGEYVAACVAGVFSLEDALKLIAEPRTASEITYFPPNISLISNITGKVASQADIATPEYWQNHIRKPVNFSASIKTLYEHEYSLFIEIGPDPTLISMAKRYMPENFGSWLPSLQKNYNDLEIVLSSLATVYQLGVDIDWEGFDSDYSRHRLPLPTYPFQRQRYWIDTSENQTQTAFGSDISHPLLHKRLQSPLEQIQFESEFTLEKLPLVTDHRMDGMPVVNMALYLEMVCAAAREAFGESDYFVQDLSISQGIIMPEVGSRIVHLVISSQSAQTPTFKIFSLPQDHNDNQKSWTLHASGKLILQSQTVIDKVIPSVDIAQLQTQYPETISGSELYQMMEKRGAKLGMSCQRLGKVWRRDGEAIAKIGVQGKVDSDKRYLLPLGAVDAWTQILVACFSELQSQMYLLSGFEKFLFYGYCGKQLWGKAKINIDSEGADDRQTILGNLWLFDETGVLVAEITNG